MLTRGVRNGHYPSAMPITPPEDEPVAGPWRVPPLSEMVSLLLNAGGRLVSRPRIVAVDGRSGSGKTTLTERLRSAVPDAEVVHTDDIAWWHSRFGWDDLMIDGVLEPLPWRVGALPATGVGDPRTHWPH